MIKHITTVITMLLTAATVMAAPITKEKAKMIAEGKLGKQVSAVDMQKRIAQQRVKSHGLTADSHIYIFNAEQNGGFAIVSSTDKTPQVLAYSTTGNIDPDNMSPATELLLSSYEEQIAALIAHPEEESPALAAQARKAQKNVSADVVEPLLLSTWGQGAPYNLLCPVSGAANSATGCVATALAQIMYYYRQPAQPMTHDISTDYGYASTLPATQFDWSKIMPFYSRHATDENAQEVAKLMQYVGHAVSMVYGTTSYADVISAVEGLRRFFNYDDNMQVVSRDAKTAEQWNDILVSELKARRPVYISATSRGQRGESGHAFICDGIDQQGLYHINWGWEGGNNGYYTFDDLRPAAEGTGGNSGSGGYSLAQEAIIGIQPASQQSNMAVRAAIYKWFVPDNATVSYTRSSTSEDFTGIVARPYIWNIAKPAIARNYDFALGLYSGDQLIQTFERAQNVQLNHTNATTGSVTAPIRCGAGLADGHYTLKMLCRESGEQTYYKAIYADNLYIDINIAGNTMTAVYPKPKPENNEALELQANSFKLTSEAIQGKPLEMTLNVTNLSTYTTTSLYLDYTNDYNLTPLTVTAKGLLLDPGQTRDIVFSYIPSTAGSHHLRVVQIVGSNRIVVAEADVNISEASSMAVQLSGNLTVDEAVSLGSYYQLPNELMNGRLTITNNGTETYDDFIDVILMSRSSLAMGGQFSGSVTVREKLTAAPGKSATMQFHFVGLAQGSHYVAVPFYYEGGTRKQLIDCPFIVCNPGLPTSLSNISANDGEASVCDLQGRKVATTATMTTLKKGIYIVNGKKIMKK